MATAAEDDPVDLLKAAGRAHIPVNPSEGISHATNSEPESAIPSSTDRPSVDDIIAEVQEQKWYKDQIVERRRFESKDGQTGNTP